ncbi:MAG: CDP-glycerol glycerophosphotransferase family protein, partial [Jatrophihabitans sp.]
MSISAVPRLRRRASSLGRRVVSVLEQEAALRGRKKALEENVVFLESFGGNGMLCNPEAIFRACHAAADLRPLRFVWGLSAGAWSDPARAELADDPRVTFVRRRSPAYYRAVGSARYLVNNATFPHAFAKRAGQTYVNTWHGTPLKAMGYDMPGGASESANIVRNFVSADFLLAPNELTERMYLDAYRMRSIYRGALLRVGTPRVDRQFSGESDRARARSRLSPGGVGVGADERIVLFAPTWRGSFAHPDDDLDGLCREVRSFAAGLRPGLRLLVKVHQRIYQDAYADGRLADFLVPNHVPTNDLLAVTDILVSDYSSIVVDFLATNGQLVIFAPDVERYGSSRGFNVSPGELPAPVCTDIAALTVAVNGLGADPRYPDAAHTRD